MIETLHDSTIDRLLEQAKNGGAELESARELLMGEKARRAALRIATGIDSTGLYCVDLENEPTQPTHPEDERWAVRLEDEGNIARSNN